MKRIEKRIETVNNEFVTVERVKVRDNEKIPTRKLNKLEKRGLVKDWFVRLNSDRVRVLTIIWSGLI